MTSPKKKKIFSFVLFILIGFSCLLAAETGMRAYHLFNKKRKYVFVPDYYLGYAHAKNNKFVWYGRADHPEFYVHHTTNSSGFPGERDTGPKEEGTGRILMMGDSYTEAFQVDLKSNFCSLLERHLNKQGIKAEVLNAGVRGYSPIHYYLAYKRKLRRLQPDIVVVQIFANDVFEDNKTKDLSVMNSQGLPVKLNRFFNEKYFKHPNLDENEVKINPILYKIHETLLDSLRIYEYIYVQAVKANKKSLFQEEKKKLPPYMDGYQFFVIQDHNNDELFNEKGFLNRAFSDTKRYLLALKELVEADGARFLLIYIPAEAQLGVTNPGDHTQMFFGARRASKRLNEMLKNLAESAQIPFLDLMPVFEDNKGRGLYFSYDGHLTPEGHMVAADALTDFVKEHVK